MKMRYLWRFMQPFRCRPNRPEANIKRIVDAGEAACGEEAVAKAAASLGYKITPEELKRAAADFEELSESDLEQVSGGNFFADLEEVLRRIIADDQKPRS